MKCLLLELRVPPIHEIGLSTNLLSYRNLGPSTHDFQQEYWWCNVKESYEFFLFNK